MCALRQALIFRSFVYDAFFPLGRGTFDFNFFDCGTWNLSIFLLMRNKVSIVSFALEYRPRRKPHFLVYLQRLCIIFIHFNKSFCWAILTARTKVSLFRQLFQFKRDRWYAPLFIIIHRVDVVEISYFSFVYSGQGFSFLRHWCLSELLFLG